MSISRKKLADSFRKVRAVVAGEIDSLMSKEPKNEVFHIPSPYNFRDPKCFDIVVNDMVRLERCFVCEVSLETNESSFSPYYHATYHKDGGRLTVVYSYNQMHKS